MAQNNSSNLCQTGAKTAQKANWLKAAVLGANDGIISIAGMVIGVASATGLADDIFTAGIAGIVAGAISLGVGEYISVSSQRDIEESLLAQKQQDLDSNPKGELKSLKTTFQGQGLDSKTASVAAQETTKKDALGVHAELDYHIDSQQLTSPWSSVFASIFSFVAGAMVPFVAIMLAEDDIRIPITFISVLLALTFTGFVTAKISHSKNIKKSMVRVIIGGAIAMIVTYFVGELFR